MVAAVLRDLATGLSCKRVAILNAGGLEELVRMLNPSGGSSSKSPRRRRKRSRASSSCSRRGRRVKIALERFRVRLPYDCRGEGVDALVAMIGGESDPGYHQRDRRPQQPRQRGREPL